jgi:uncharacterized membrane protein YdjX (TVP38/TMEM64 family)/rhodanese-related sulfurtransferase
MDFKTLARAALLALLAAAMAVAFIYRDALNAAALETWVQRAGIWGPVIFAGVYVAATVLFLPGSVLTLAGGALFGPVLGTLYSLTAATIGATLAFAIARYLAADWVARKAGGRTRQLIDGVEQEGWRFVAFVRLVPLVPFNLLNYALGLTRVRLLHYVVASFLFMLPGAVAYTYLGYAGREALAGGEGVIRKALIAVALLGVVAFVPRLVRRLRGGSTVQPAEATALTAAALKARLDAGEDILVLDVRTAADYAGPSGCITGAMNVPLEELPQRLGEIERLRERQLAVVCRTNRRSGEVVRQLRARGFRKALLVEDGMAAWERQGFPTERPNVGAALRV